MTMLFSDAVEIAGVRETRDGYWVADCRVARANNVQRYAGHEVGRPDLDTVDVFRPRDEVMKRDSLATFAHKPVCLGHPSESVTAQTWKDVAVGTIGGDVVADGEVVRVSLALMDADAIRAVRDDGVREISMGYTCDLDFCDGETDDGTPYQAVMRDIRINHGAIVPRGRAGSTCRFGDHSSNPQQQKGPDMPETTLRTVTVDGLSISTTDQGAQAIDKLTRQLSDALAANAGLHTQHDAALAAMRTEHERKLQSLEGQIAAIRSDGVRAVEAKDAEIVGLSAGHKAAVEAKDAEIAGLKGGHQQAIEAKDAEIAALQAKIPDGAAMDALIAERLGLIAAAKRFLGDAFSGEGKTSADIRRAAVAKGIGEQAAAAMADEHVSIAFDTMVRMAPAAHRPDPIRDTIRTSVVPPAGGVAPTGDPIMDARVAADAARAAHLAKLENAWRQPAA